MLCLRVFYYYLLRLNLELLINLERVERTEEGVVFRVNEGIE